MVCVNLLAKGGTMKWFILIFSIFATVGCQDNDQPKAEENPYLECLVKSEKQLRVEVDVIFDELESPSVSTTEHTLKVMAYKAERRNDEAFFCRTESDFVTMATELDKISKGIDEIEIPELKLSDFRK
jgi:hypothetical protein